MADTATRTVIIGAPRAGKTTLARKLANERGCELRHTDDLITEHAWSELSAYVAMAWLPLEGPWIIEGVAAVRALRKWLKANDGAPCDEVIVLEQPHVQLSKRQAGMAKACDTIWREIHADLELRGVTVRFGAC